MKKIITICLFSLPLLYFSQNYRSAVGVKLGYPGFSSLNGKIFLGKKIALDNSIGVNFDRDNRYLAYQGLIEYNKKFGLNEGYNWYAGLGPGVNYFTKGGYLENDASVLPYKTFVKVDGVFGAEFSAPRTHFNAAIEAGPSFIVTPVFKIGYFVNIAFRYTFKTDKYR